MNYGLSDKVRERARLGYVKPAMESGKLNFSIAVKDLQRELESDGFPPNHTRQVCKALASGKFLSENNLKIEKIDGPPSKTSTTVVVHYRISPSVAGSAASKVQTEGTENRTGALQETPEEWAHRLTGKICGLLKDELAAYGGGEAFIRWVRGYDEEDVA